MYSNVLVDGKVDLEFDESHLPVTRQETTRSVQLWYLGGGGVRYERFHSIHTISCVDGYHCRIGWLTM